MAGTGAGVVGWDAATNANVLVAVATLVMAVVTWKMAVATRRMAESTKEESAEARRSTAAAEASVEAAERAVQAARDQLTEVTRTRVDSLAPIVAMRVGPAQHAQLLQQRGKLPQDGGFFLLSGPGRHSSTEVGIGDIFTFDRDAEKYLWFDVPCYLRNEGSMSVQVRVDAESDSHSVGGGPGYHKTFSVGPGGGVDFIWADGHTLREWVQGREEARFRHLRLTVLVEDARRTVVDYLFAEVGGTLLEPVPDAMGQWRLTSTTVSGTVYPTERWYRHEGGPYPESPWSRRED